jgi:predicted Zn-dependent peptidase
MLEISSSKRRPAESGRLFYFRPFVFLIPLTLLVPFQAAALLATPPGPAPAAAPAPIVNAASASSAAQKPPPITHYRLPNGLDLVVAARPELRLAAVNLTVNLGSADDPPDREGMAHLLEHVTLGGSTSLGSLDPKAEAAALADLDSASLALDRARHEPAADAEALAGLERRFAAAHAAARRYAESGEIVGGRLEARGGIGANASTTADATQFFTWMPAEEVETWLAIEAERLRRPIFRRFYSERTVVLREIEDLTAGRRTPQERFMADLFADGPQGRPKAGDPAAIRDIERPEALAYFHRFYRPENIAIAVVGGVDPERIRQLCARYFGAWQAEGAAPPRPRQAAILTAPAARAFNSVRNPLLFLALPQPTAGTPEAAAAEALSELINSPDLSPLYRAMVQEQPASARAVGAETRYPSEKYESVLLVHVYGSPGIVHADLLHQSARLLAGLADAPADDLQGAILAAEMRLATQLDDPPTLASLLALHQATHGDWSVPFQRLEALRHLDVAQLRATARRLFAALPADLPPSGPAAAGAPPAAQAPAAAPPPPSAPGSVPPSSPAPAGTVATFPPVPGAAPQAPAGVARLNLANGLRILVGGPRWTALFAEILLVVRTGTGTAAAGAEREELARLAAEALFAGSAPSPPATASVPIRLRLARLGVSLDSTVGPQVTVFRFAVPARNAGALVALLGDLLSRRRLADAAWDEAVARRSADLANRQSDPWQHASAQLDELTWSQAPQGGGEAPGGTAAAPPPAAGEPLTRAALARMWAESYVPANMVLVVSGEPAGAALAPALREAFGRLAPGGAPALRPMPEPVPAHGGRLLCLREEGATPPALLLGLGTSVETDLDFYAWQLTAQLLAGSSRSRLQRRLQAGNQVVYTVEASGRPVGKSGLQLRVACQTDQAAAVREVIVEELRRLTAEEAGLEEIELARTVLRSRLRLDQASPSDPLYRQALDLLGVPGVRDPGAAEALLGKLTPGALLQLLRRSLRLDDLMTVLISAQPEPLCQSAPGTPGR